MSIDEDIRVDNPMKNESDSTSAIPLTSSLIVFRSIVQPTDIMEITDRVDSASCNRLDSRVPPPGFNLGLLLLTFFLLGENL